MAALATPTKSEGVPTPKASNLTPMKTQSTTSTAATRPAANGTHAAVTRSVSSTSMSHEDFKNQLVHDVFGRDNKGRVPMEKVAMLIWQFRDDPAVVQFMAQFVAKVRHEWRAQTVLKSPIANPSMHTKVLWFALGFRWH